MRGASSFSSASRRNLGRCREANAGFTTGRAHYKGVMPIQSRLLATSGSQDDGEEKKAAPRKKKKTKKMVINENWQSEFNAEALSKAFDDLARKEGFDKSTAFYDGPVDDSDSIDVFLDNEDDDDGAFILDDDEIDFDDDIIDFGDGTDNNVEDSMEARILAARSDASTSRFSVPKELDDLASSAEEEFRKLGFNREANPFGSDETPRAIYAVVENAMQCSACGSDFQPSDDQKPGYLPPAKFDIQQKLKQIEDAQKRGY
jgi:hypothetical protein